MICGMIEMIKRDVFFFRLPTMWKSTYGCKKIFSSIGIFFQGRLRRRTVNTILTTFRQRSRPYPGGRPRETKSIIQVRIKIIWHVGLMSIVFANGPGYRGSIPGRVIPKTQKMVLDAALLNTQHCKIRIKGKL